ncbi:TRAP transporter substrate-binding protein [Ottowia pentelensis]|uniref:TRAP transporter substrate-binding protein n=1 Tax=Ottowia pentelensis TaxID=511108 RepID=A0ABV6PUS6_9BURK
MSRSLTTTRMLASTVIVTSALMTGVSVQAADTIKLKYANSYPTGHPSDLRAKEFIAEVEKLSGHKIEISYFPAEQLGKAKDMLSVCGKGIADICDIHVTYFAGQLPYNNTIVLPLWTTAVEGSAIYQWMLESVPDVRGEFDKFNVIPLYGSTTPSYNVATVEKPVRSLEDLKGLKLKTAGGLYDTIAKHYGITPVSIPAAETYEALQRGLVSGVIFNYPSIRSYRLNDIVKYITDGMRAGGYPGAVIMNKRAWQKLPKESQQVIAEAARKMSAVVGQSWDSQQDVVREEFRKQGIEIYELTPEQKVTWVKELSGLPEQYIKEIESRGFGKIRGVVDAYKKKAAEVTGQ